VSGDIVLSATALGKRYDLAAARARRSLPHELLRLLTGTFERREHWALRGVDLEIRRGEIVGVVGANGAGKSTLLLLLAGIAEPSEGRVTSRGRTDLFFQLASGLQPRLSVLDNLRLCAALLGHDRGRTRRQESRILKFAGLEDYREALYGELSSGLAARLPFSVALHGELEVVLADEAVSVGDAAFQARCAEAFQGLKQDGKTVLLATHDLDLVREQCTRAIYLEKGRIVAEGAPRDVVDRYWTTVKP
jgi:ABC-type polysaccharide/polyol phosphate transport system ATPase subunit